MTKVEEAWAKLEPPCCAARGCVDRKKDIRAGFLAVHVDACVRDSMDGTGEWAKRCGVGWYCDTAKSIQELGQ